MKNKKLIQIFVIITLIFVLIPLLVFLSFHSMLGVRCRNTLEYPAPNCDPEILGIEFANPFMACKFEDGFTMGLTNPGSYGKCEYK